MMSGNLQCTCKCGCKAITAYEICADCTKGEHNE